MDVDLLRPGTVPISPDTVLWFEFLLDPNLLKSHLSKPNPEPSACELIEEFINVDTKQATSKPTSERIVDVDAPPSPPTPTPGPLQFTRKQLALKILALKVAATLHWNLDIFETKLPPQTQQHLMQDLVYMATDTNFAIPPQDVPVEMFHKPQAQFALTLYHRWVLRFPVKTALYSKSNKLPFVHVPGLQGDTAFSPLNQNFEKILRMCEASRIQSIRYLDSVLSYYETTLGRKDARKIKVPVREAFVHLTEDINDMNHNWNAGDTVISQYELAMQIHFDLCYNYFFYGQHDLAKQHILGCRENSNLLEKEVASYGYGPHKTVPWGEFYYASMTKDDILGYIRALNLGYEVLNEEPSLLQKLQESIANHYTGIIGILQADNLARVIPMVHRDVVELDIQGSASSGAFTVARDLLNRVAALNAVRYSLEGGIPSTHPDFLNKLKTSGIKFFDLLLWAMAPVLMSNLSEKDWENLRVFFLHLATSQYKLPIDRLDEYLKKYVGDASESIRRKLIPDEHLKEILNDPNNIDDENIDIPKELLTDDWETPDFDFKSVPELEMGRLKKRLIEASTADDVRMCLVKLAMMSPTSPLWKLSPSWKPPSSLVNALMALPRGFLQDFGYIVSGTARARLEAGYAKTALSLLSALEGEARSQLGGGSDPNLYRLCRQLSWEVLLLQVNVMLSEWPHHHINLTVLANKCKACIAVATSGDNVVPRPQVLEACWTCLLNACEWEVTGVSGGAGETSAALCAACFELQRGKGARKFPRALWDYALSVYSNGSNVPVKRTAAGMPAHSRDAPNAAAEARNAFNSFLTTLREPLAISVMMSLLARIHNLIINDNSLELNVEYTNLWPPNISNINNYNLKHVLESLTELLERSLRLYPYNTSWLRLYGDVEMAGGRWAAALRRYLCSLAANTWHFTKRAPDEGGIARRAARCCQALCAPTQAAALCQLPDEPDYTIAFKCLAEKTGNAADAMDGYYGCLWDGTLLEVGVALHARRGEGGRRARAVKAAGALELNANNSEDIQREAAAIRRARLLRALTNQYVV
ncbi:integrator complex subunit 8 like protein [Danaus plexippus plexippus]|uniref:Integrator complex subunit 8 like protein n=1 Tax=Danaus plexippus plexippus TaxID=278856 RepID=A0A212F005_DANPL|nr:integrator complex subunit 8 [Danaus plexippus plexippus]OWR47070.1 integrator complex subunit 8 like protein [Danaus plexippus plexippus]